MARSGTLRLKINIRAYHYIFLVLITVLPFVISANGGHFVGLSSDIEEISVCAQGLSVWLGNGKLHEIQAVEIQQN